MRRRMMMQGRKVLKIDPNYCTIVSYNKKVAISFPMQLSYRIGNDEWGILPAGNEIVLQPNNYIQFKANLNSLTTSSGVGTFTITGGNCGLEGNSMSLLYGDNASAYNSIGDYKFKDLFYKCDTIVSVSEDFLPATSLSKYCYHRMFAKCSGITNAPKLPAEKLMASCYESMFSECGSLVSPPELPATTLATKCYYSMFQYCLSMTKAPDLPATTLVSNCYSFMFYSCSSLSYIKASFTTTPSATYTSSWVQGVAENGTFVKSKKATWTTMGNNAVPSGWTIKTE